MVGRRCVGAGAMQDAGVTGEMVQALGRMSRFGCEEGGAAAPPYRGIWNPVFLCIRVRSHVQTSHEPGTTGRTGFRVFDSS